MSKDIQPIFIMPEGTQRDSGKTAQRNNIMAAKLIAETVRTTLGPKGMDKMIVDSVGDVIVTNDGATIVKELQIEHPVAKMIVEVAKTQDDEVGDGTTTAVVLAGELLKNAEGLLDRNVHPTIISKGYRLAAEKSQEILVDIAEDVSIKNLDVLKKIAITAMTGKGAEGNKELLSNLTVEAVKEIIDDENSIDIRDIKIEKKVGSGVNDSELVKGMVIDKERVHPGMPNHVNNAKITLIDSALEIKSTEMDAKIQISEPSQMQAFIEQEEKMLREMVNKIVASGANVVICQKGIDDLAQHFLAKQDVLAVRRVKKSDMEKISRATGAKIATTLDELKPNDLGKAGKVFATKLGDDDYIYIEECPSPRAVTVVIRGASKYATDEAERALNDALSVVRNAIEDGKMVFGGGAAEIHMHNAVKKLAEQTTGKEGLAIEKFAEALLIIPNTLAENSGLDPLDIISELTAAYAKGKKNVGLDLSGHAEGGKIGKVGNMKTAGVFEPLRVKVQAIQSASEAAELILRIDDVIATKSSEGAPGGMPPGMDEMGGMGGMGGMPPGMM